MGCFLACFGSSEVEKRRKRSKRVQPRDRRCIVYKPALEGSSSFGNAFENPPVSETREKPKEVLSLGKRKKVTFDSNVKVYEPVLLHEEADLLLERESGQKQEKNSAKYPDPIQHKPSPVDNHVPSSYGTYPPNHRYQSCNDRDEEDEALDYADCDLDQMDNEETDDEGDEFSENDDEEEWKREASEMESSTEEIRELAEKESEKTEKNRAYRDRSAFVHPVLNPVENLSQWKAVKARGALNVEKKAQKENSSGLNLNTDQSSKFQLAVDASLSNWLISSETRR